MRARRPTVASLKACTGWNWARCGARHAQAAGTFAHVMIDRFRDISRLCPVP
jgi:hypothetical protein